ncbi:MAG: UDP-glucose 4-epimerase GalE [Alphaproteobacteria bacterium]|nr:UDP-glucose 4-epimerase GalE [Alphaproteobacteria bacterium]
MAKKILVTGGAGYIGSHMLKDLKARGLACVVLDDLSTGYAENITHGEFVKASLADPSALGTLFAGHDIGAVIHFAGFSLVGESVTQPEKYWRNNLIGTKNLLDAMARAGVRRLIFSSTAAVYGRPDVSLIPEDQPLRPVNPYGASKLAVEMMLADYAGAGLLDFTALRYFNAAGADPEGEIGECHDPETHLIPLVLQAASGRRAKIRVFGDDYDTPDGTCLRDYIHVTDLCAAHYLALQHLEGGGESLHLNLGTGAGYSVREVIDCSRRVTGRDFTVEAAPRRAGDPPRLVADSARARDILGWKPGRADLETIIRDAWNWEKKLGQKNGAGKAGEGET